MMVFKIVCVYCSFDLIQLDFVVIKEGSKSF